MQRGKKRERLAAERASELETVPEAEEKSWTTEGEASVLELEQSAAERDVANIVEGHADLLAMRDQMFIDDSNTPCLIGYETIHFDSGANCILLKTEAMLAASKPIDLSKGALGTASQSGKLTHEGTANVTMSRCTSRATQTSTAPSSSRATARRSAATKAS